MKILIILFLSFRVIVPCVAQSHHNNSAKDSKYFSKLEDTVIGIIAKLPEVKRRMKYVEKESKGTRHLQFTIWANPNKRHNYYWVKVMEDNGAQYITHFNFFVTPETFLIKYFDTANDRVIALSTWRKTYKD